MRMAVWAIPLPWIAAETGWFVAEYGRQPWTISGILPTHMSVSNLTVGQLWFSLAGFLIFYTVLLVIELYLMIKYVKLGPSSLHTGRYCHETKGVPSHAT
jgi:cytochrome d ubiquinol oxidase subunit I